MSRYLGIIFVFSLIFLYACGGGGAKAPATPGVNAGADGSSSDLDQRIELPLTPEAVSARMPTSGYVSDEVLIKSGADEERLSEIVEKYGYELKYKRGNHAAVRVPDGDLPLAISQLSREQAIFNASVNGEFHMPTVAIPLGEIENVMNRAASFTPMDRYYGDTYEHPDWTTDPSDEGADHRHFAGVRMFMDMAGIPGAWDISFGAGATIAVIYGGMLVIGDTYEGLFIHRELQDDLGGEFMELARLRTDSARVQGDGSFTTVADDPDIITNVVDSTVYGVVADTILGVTSSNIDFNINVPVYAPGSPPPDNDPARTYPTSIPGVAPAAEFMMVATGTIDTGALDPEWVFTADELAASIEYAVDNGADVIISGYWAPVGDFSPEDLSVLQDAVDYARANDVVVVAPVGYDIDDEGDYYDDTDPDNPFFTFNESFTSTDFVPASLDGVLSVGSTGISSPNLDYVFTQPSPFFEFYRAIAGYSASDANMYAPGFAHTTYYANLNDENDLSWYGLFIGTDMSAAYVGGTVALMYSAFRSADPGMVDIDHEVLVVLVSEDEEGLMGTNLLLRATAAVALAANGGYDLIGPALDVGATLPVSSDAVETNMEFSLEPVITGGLEPYEILIDWGDGTTYPEGGDYEAWESGTIYEKVGGYTEPGVFGLTLYARDSRGSIATEVATLLVTNPLGADPTVHELPDGPAIAGALPDDPIPLFLGTDYFFHANPYNLISVSEEQANYSWDFDDGSALATEENPIHQFGSTGSYLITLTIDDGIRPIFEIELEVDVS